MLWMLGLDIIFSEFVFCYAGKETQTLSPPPQEDSESILGP